MPSALEPRLTRHAHGITSIDAEYVRVGLAAVHVIERGGRAALVDTGTNASAPLVLRALELLGIGADAVELLLLTHVHLDHAGGAGLLASHLPNARVVVHPRGAAHLIDPARLESATIAVYGTQAYAQLYGKLVPIAAERIVQTRDGDRCQLGPSELGILHTPGHALHHQAFFDADASAVFSGDTFGLSYREHDTEQGAFSVPTTTPTQFDPEQLKASIRRLAELQPQSVVLTHFGPVSGVDRLARSLIEQIDQHVDIARRHAHSQDRALGIRTELKALWVALARAHGVAAAEASVEAVLGADLELNTQGLVAWLERLARQ
jgi:glyoxylase-like metal-dependent hydrolase (beta-lactamase superfamily II)